MRFGYIFRFPLSLRLVEEMLLERGIVVSYETVRCWAIKLEADYVSRLRRKTPGRRDVWHLDKMVITINGEKRYTLARRRSGRLCSLTKSSRSIGIQRPPSAC